MNIVFYIANAMVLPPAMHFAWNFYRYKGGEIAFRQLWITIFLLTITVIVTSLQFIFPEIIPALSRDRQAILSGEYWRFMTSLLIQPIGLWQCIFNAVFFISFVPVAEHLYGRAVLLIYFGASLFGQVLILNWESTPGGIGSSGGGTSTALYAVMGSLLMYVFINRGQFPKGYVLIPVAGFLGAAILVFFEDGHAPSLLMGGFLGLLLSGYARQIGPYPQLKVSDRNVSEAFDSSKRQRT